MFLSLHVLVSQSFLCIIWFLRPGGVVVCEYTDTRKIKTHTLPSNYMCKTAAGDVGWGNLTNKLFSDFSFILFSFVPAHVEIML